MLWLPTLAKGREVLFFCAVFVEVWCWEALEMERADAALLPGGPLPSSASGCSGFGIYAFGESTALISAFLAFSLKLDKCHGKES